MSSAQLGVFLQHLRQLTAAHAEGGPTDRQLLESFLTARDEAAFAELVRRHGPMVLGVCRSVLRDRHDAEDAFQATFLVLAQRAASIRRREAVAGWLCGVAHNLALKVRSASVRWRGRCERRGEPAVADPLLDMTLRELHQVLLEELQHLPEKYRLPLVLCYLEGRTQAEAARQLGWNREVLRGRLNRGRSQLRARLTRRGLTLSAGVFVASLSGVATSAALPAERIQAAAKAAWASATGQGANGLVSERVAALAEGAVRALRAGHGKIATLLVLALGFLTAAAGLWAQRYVAAPAPAVQAADTPLMPLMPKENPGKPRPEAALEVQGETIAVRGRVLDPDDKPFAGAKLYLWVNSNYETVVPARVRATSGPEGRFHFTFTNQDVAALGGENANSRALPWRGSLVLAAAPGCGAVWADIASLDRGEAVLRLVKDDIPIRGRIRDLQGRPVAGAVVQVKNLGTFHRPLWAGLPEKVTTDKDGRFTLTGLGRGREAVLRIAAPRIALEEVAVSTATAATATFDLVAGPTKPIEGTVRARDTGAPLAGVRVVLHYPELPRPGFLWRDTEFATDARGCFRVEGLIPGLKHELGLGGDPKRRITVLAGEKLKGLSVGADGVKNRGDIVVKVAPLP